MNAPARPRPRWLVPLLIGIPLLMASLGLVIFPSLYSLYCRMTGTEMAPNAAVRMGEQSTGRFLGVFFEAKVYDGLPVRFWCDHPSQRVEVGRDSANTYHLTNQSDRVLHIRPIHLVAPNAAAPHFAMTVCFCFTDQQVQPGATIDFPVVYRFRPELDARVGTVTVCYDLFSIAPGTAPSRRQREIQDELRRQGGVVSPNFRWYSEQELEALGAAEKQKGAR